MLDGWAPVERHDHYNPAGELTGWTIVTREGDWDDRSRDEALALADYEANCCTNCGYHVSIIDNEPLLVPVEQGCVVCAAMDRHARDLHAGDKKAGKPPEDGRPWRLDGVRRGLRLATPDEVAEYGRKTRR